MRCSVMSKCLKISVSVFVGLIFFNSSAMPPKKKTSQNKSVQSAEYQLKMGTIEAYNANANHVIDAATKGDATEALWCFIANIALHGNFAQKESMLYPIAWELYYAWRTQVTIFDYIEYKKYGIGIKDVLSKLREILCSDVGRKCSWISTRQTSKNLLNNSLHPELIKAQKHCEKHKCFYIDQQTINNYLTDVLECELVLVMAYTDQQILDVQAIKKVIETCLQNKFVLSSPLMNEIFTKFGSLWTTGMAIMCVHALNRACDQIYNSLELMYKNITPQTSLYEFYKEFGSCLLALQLRYDVLHNLSYAYERQRDLFLEKDIQSFWQSSLNKHYQAVLQKVHHPSLLYCSDFLNIHSEYGAVALLQKKYPQVFEKCFTEQERLCMLKDFSIYKDYSNPDCLFDYAVIYAIKNPWLTCMVLVSQMGEVYQAKGLTSQEWAECCANFKKFIQEHPKILKHSPQKTREALLGLFVYYSAWLCSSTSYDSEKSKFCYDVIQGCGLKCAQVDKFCTWFLTVEKDGKAFDHMYDVLQSGIFDKTMIAWLKFVMPCIGKVVQEDVIFCQSYSAFIKKIAKNQQAGSYLQFIYYCHCAQSERDIDDALLLLKKMSEQDLDYLADILGMFPPAVLYEKVCSMKSVRARYIGALIPFFKNGASEKVPGAFLAKAKRYIIEDSLASSDVSARIKEYFNALHDATVALQELKSVLQPCDYNDFQNNVNEVINRGVAFITTAYEKGIVTRSEMFEYLACDTFLKLNPVLIFQLFTTVVGRFLDQKNLLVSEIVFVERYLDVFEKLLQEKQLVVEFQKKLDDYKLRFVNAFIESYDNLLGDLQKILATSPSFDQLVVTLRDVLKKNSRAFPGSVKHNVYLQTQLFIEILFSFCDQQSYKKAVASLINDGLSQQDRLKLLCTDIDSGVAERYKLCPDNKNLERCSSHKSVEQYSVLIKNYLVATVMCELSKFSGAFSKALSQQEEAVFFEKVNFAKKMCVDSDVNNKQLINLFDAQIAVLGSKYTEYAVTSKIHFAAYMLFMQKLYCYACDKKPMVRQVLYAFERLSTTVSVSDVDAVKACIQSYKTSHMMADFLTALDKHKKMLAVSQQEKASLSCSVQHVIKNRAPKVVDSVKKQVGDDSVVSQLAQEFEKTVSLEKQTTLSLSKKQNMFVEHSKAMQVSTLSDFERKLLEEKAADCYANDLPRLEVHYEKICSLDVGHKDRLYELYRFALAVHDFQKQIEIFKPCTSKIANTLREFLVKALHVIAQNKCTKVQFTEFVRKMIVNHCGSILNKARLWKGISDNCFSNMISEDYKILSGTAIVNGHNDILSAHARIAVFLFYVVAGYEKRADYVALLNSTFYANTLPDYNMITNSLGHYLDTTLFVQLYMHIINSIKITGIPLQQDPATFFKPEDLKACVKASCVNYLTLCALR